MRIRRPQTVWLFPFSQGMRYLCGRNGGRLAVKLFGFPARSFFQRSCPPFFEGFWVSKLAQVFELFEVLWFKVAFHLFALEFYAYGAWTRISRLPISFTPGKAIISQYRSPLVIHTTQSLLCLCCLLSKASTLTLSFSLQGCHWPLQFPVPIRPIASKLSHWAAWIPTLRFPRRAMTELFRDVSTLLPHLLELTTGCEQTLQGKFAPASQFFWVFQSFL